MTYRPAAAPPRAPRVAALPWATQDRWPSSPAHHPSAHRFRSARSLIPALPQPECSRSPGRCSAAGRLSGRRADAPTRSGVLSPTHRQRHHGSRTAPSPRPAPPTSPPRPACAALGLDASRPAAGETSGTGNARSGPRRAGVHEPAASDRTGTPAESYRRPGLLGQLLLLLGYLQPGARSLHRRTTGPVPVRPHAAGPLRGSCYAGSPRTGKQGVRRDLTRQ
jgi:hypothetical protein